MVIEFIKQIFQQNRHLSDRLRDDTPLLLSKVTAVTVFNLIQPLRNRCHHN